MKAIIFYSHKIHHEIKNTYTDCCKWMKMSHSPRREDKDSFKEISELLRNWAFPEKKQKKTRNLHVGDINGKFQGYAEI